MKTYDVSVPIRMGMPVFPGDPKFRSRKLKSLESGDGVSMHKMILSNHVGTHIDAPAHFISGGATIDQLSLDLMNGRVRVVEIHNGEKVDVKELQQFVLMDDFRILFKTRNSLLWRSRKRYSRNHVYISPEASRHLVENGIKFVGFDYLSIDRPGDDSFPSHKILLDNGVILLEGLNLADVEEGEYEMSCLPLLLAGLDAAPARVILRK
jgi:arylformamidase